jgi:[protein-PII] uridylyltransferase
MTSWKARMLDELFIATDSWLRSEDAPSAEQRRREAISKALAHAVDGDERDMLARYLDSMPERYPLVTPPNEVVAHARVVREQISAETPASLALVPLLRHEAAQLCVVAPDRPGLLANIAAALSAARLHVHAAQIYSCMLGDARLAVDLFWVQRSGQSAAQNDHAAAVEPQLGRLRRDLRAVLEGEVDAAALVGARAKGGRKERGGPAVVTRVGVDNRASPDHTVVEVITRDRPGLLFALSHAIYSHGLSIAVAKIATEGTRVVDVFYVSEQSGDKIADGERADRLRQALVALIEGMDP